MGKIGVDHNTGAKTSSVWEVGTGDWAMGTSAASASRLHCSSSEVSLEWWVSVR